MKNSFLFGFLVLANVLYAQKDFRDGYVISLSKDTIYGKIDYRSEKKMSQLCRFQNKEGAIVDYTPNEIEGFRFIDSKYFISRKLNNRGVFLEYLIKGKINVYYFVDEFGGHYYMDKENEPLKEIPYEKGTKYVGDREVFYESKEHVGLLNLYMKDAPELKSKIQYLGRPTHRKMIKLAEDYHNYVCEDDKCIVYENTASLVKFFPEIIGGITKFSSSIANINPDSYTHVGLIGHLWMPRTSEKLYLRTGLVHIKADLGEEGVQGLYRLPFQIEYIYPKNKIKPRIAYGKNLYLSSGDTTTLINLGVNLNLSQKLGLSITSDIETYSNALVLPGEFISYSLQMGLFLKI